MVGKKLGKNEKMGEGKKASNVASKTQLNLVATKIKNKQLNLMAIGRKKLKAD
jgi:hypothetical protein